MGYSTQFLYQRPVLAENFKRTSREVSDFIGPHIIVYLSAKFCYFFTIFDLTPFLGHISLLFTLNIKFRHEWSTPLRGGVANISDKILPTKSCLVSQSRHTRQSVAKKWNNGSRQRLKRQRCEPNWAMDYACGPAYELQSNVPNSNNENWNGIIDGFITGREFIFHCSIMASYLIDRKGPKPQKSERILKHVSHV